ncbi:glycosyltransferase [Saxibacter everestensis]|uniref:D-inositol 3-phosphate glycosyltransferase n=1 Tax=Saxibacter everestensis TaxID=2909229 RepID=A0ABY8QT55_9MICO|nr:glycosyltransferase [Brevibacteriaceae bacterium ZFBP1038]
MLRRKQYSRVIIHQFDPESPVPGGVDTCIRDLLDRAPEGERILVIGVSRTRPLHRRVTLESFRRPIDFIPVSRANPGDQVRFIPHSIRVALGSLLPLAWGSTRRSVVQIHRVEAGLVTRLFPSRRRVYFVHTNTAASLESHSDSFWRKAPRAFRLLERAVLRSADLTVVFNKESAAGYAADGYLVKHMRTWYNEELYHPLLDAENRSSTSPTVLWVGRLEAPKDPLLAIDAFATLKRDSPRSWRCLVVGDGTLRDDMMHRISAHCLEGSVELTGAVSRSKVAELMRDADVLLMTSRFEGSPRVMYEAMGSALPVVASVEADPDFAIQHSKNGIRITGREAGDFAKAIDQAMGLPRDDVYESVRAQAASTMVAEVWDATKGEPS